MMKSIAETKIVILGSGGYGRTVADIAVQLGYEPIVLDDNSLHPCAEFSLYSASVIPAFGNNELRLEWCGKIDDAGCKLATLIHPTAYVSPTASIDHGVVVLPRAVINTNTTIKKGSIINCGAIIDHDCMVEEGAHVCLGAIVKGDNRIPKCMKIEAGQVIERGAYPYQHDEP